MAVVIQVTQYQAEDGSLFLTEVECDAHDFKLKNGAKIEVMADAFLNATGAIDRSRNMQRNVIEAFLSYTLPRLEAGTELVPVERTVFDTPKPVAVEGTEAKAEADAEVAAAEPAPAVDGEQDAQPMF